MNGVGTQKSVFYGRLVFWRRLRYAMPAAAVFWFLWQLCIWQHRCYLFLGCWIDGFPNMFCSFSAIQCFSLWDWSLLFSFWGFWYIRTLYLFLSCREFLVVLLAHPRRELLFPILKK